MDFVSRFLDHTKDYESPTSFWKWASYSAISAVLRDSIHRRQGDIVTYPNIYVLFLAQSGARKGAPINLATSLITKVNNTKIISGRTSAQAILDELSHVETSQKTGKVIKGGAAILIAGELAAGIVSDPAAIGILTDIYDLKTDFKHHLRSTGKFKIDKIVFSMLSASNADLLKEVYTQSAVHGGLLGRTFLVVPDEFRPPNALLDDVDPVVEEGKEKLYDLLREIAQLTGEIHVSQEAKDEYKRWYEPFYRSLEKKGDKSGILSRLHMGVFKLSIILAANELDTSIRKCHIEKSIDEVTTLIPNYQSFVMASGKSTITEAGTILITVLRGAADNRITRKKFLQQNWMNVDSETLDKVAATLEQGGLLKSISAGSDIIYKLTTSALEIMAGKEG